MSKPAAKGHWRHIERTAAADVDSIVGRKIAARSKIARPAGAWADSLERAGDR